MRSLQQRPPKPSVGRPPVCLPGGARMLCSQPPPWELQIQKARWGLGCYWGATSSPSPSPSSHSSSPLPPSSPSLPLSTLLFPPLTSPPPPPSGPSTSYPPPPSPLPPPNPFPFLPLLSLLLLSPSLSSSPFPLLPYPLPAHPTLPPHGWFCLPPQPSASWLTSQWPSSSTSSSSPSRAPDLRSTFQTQPPSSS